jgi:cation:H+ antiporter
MLLSCFLLIAGLALIILGGDLFVSASVRIAEFLRVPRIVIGSTLVSLATTSPELVVAVVSGLRGASGLAVGNAVGSCVCNIGLILGLMAVLKNVAVHRDALRVPLTAMLVAGFILLLMTLDLGLTRSQGLLLCSLGVVYFMYDFRRHHRGGSPLEAVEAEQVEKEHLRGRGWFETGRGTAVQFAGGAILVVAGSKLLVDAAVTMATALGIPSIVIGLTLVAVGTSLPELVTAVSSSRRNVSDLAVGNILGANVANLTLIIGSAASLNDVVLSRTTQMFNFPSLLLCMAIVVYAVYAGGRVTRRRGVFLLGFYGLYLAGILVMTILGRA